MAPLLAVLLASSWSKAAAADDVSYANDYENGERPAQALAYRDVVGRLEVGYRGVFVTNPGFGPFSKQDYFSGAALVLSRTLVALSRSSFAIGLGWDYGSSQATARGDDTSLSVHRVMVPLDGRVHFGPFGYAFVRIAPGVAYERIELDDPSAPFPLVKARWLFSTDASVGYAIPVVPLPARSASGPRVWIQGDAGYSWVADQRLTFHPQSGGSADSADGIDLRMSLGLRGAFVRAVAAFSY